MKWVARKLFWLVCILPILFVGLWVWYTRNFEQHWFVRVEYRTDKFLEFLARVYSRLK